MARSDVKAFNHDQGDAAAVIGPARSRLRQLVIFANSAGAVTIKDGSGGSDILVQSFPTGLHHLTIPDDGILAERVAFTSTLLLVVATNLLCFCHNA